MNKENIFHKRMEKLRYRLLGRPLGDSEVMIEFYLLSNKNSRRTKGIIYAFEHCILSYSLEVFKLVFYMSDNLNVLNYLKFVIDHRLDEYYRIEMDRRIMFIYENSREIFEKLTLDDRKKLLFNSRTKKEIEFYHKIGFFNIVEIEDYIFKLTKSSDEISIRMLNYLLDNNIIKPEKIIECFKICIKMDNVKMMNIFLNRDNSLRYEKSIVDVLWLQNDYLVRTYVKKS